MRRRLRVLSCGVKSRSGEEGGIRLPLHIPFLPPFITPNRPPPHPRKITHKSLAKGDEKPARFGHLSGTAKTSQGGVGVHRKRETGPPLAGLLVFWDSRAWRVARGVEGRRAARRGLPRWAGVEPRGARAPRRPSRRRWPGRTDAPGQPCLDRRCRLAASGAEPVELAEPAHVDE